jgi:hypothetical protein
LSLLPLYLSSYVQTTSYWPHPHPYMSLFVSRPLSRQHSYQPLLGDSKGFPGMLLLSGLGLPFPLPVPSWSRPSHCTPVTWSLPPPEFPGVGSTWLVPPHPEGPSPFTAPGIFPVFVATRDLPSSLPVFLLWPFRVCLSYWEHLPRRQGPGAPLSLGVHFCVST